MSGLNPTSEALRSKHIKTLDALKGVLDENKRLKARVEELEAASASSVNVDAAPDRTDDVMKIVALEAEVERLNEDNAALRSEVGKTKSLMEKVTLMQDGADRTTLKLQNQSAEIERLRQRNSELEAQQQNATTDKMLTEARNQLESAKNTISAQKVTISSLTESRAQLQSRLNAAQDALSQAENQCAELPSPTTHKRVAADSAALREQNEQLKAENATYRQLLAKANEAKGEAESRAKNATMELEFGRQELQKLQEQLERSRQELRRTSTSLEHSRRDHDALQARVAGLEDELIQQAAATAAAKEAAAQSTSKTPAPVGSKFAQHVDGSRKLKEQNRILQKKNAQLTRQLQRLSGKR